MIAHKAVLINKIKEKLEVDRMTPFIKPESIAWKDEDERILVDLMRELEHKRLVERNSPGCWQIVIADLDKIRYVLQEAEIKEDVEYDICEV